MDAPNVRAVELVTTESEDRLWLDKILPLVRVCRARSFRFGGKRDLLALYPDALVVVNRLKSGSIPDLFHTAANASSLVAQGQVSPRDVLPLDSLTWAVVRPASLLGRARYTFVTAKRRVHVSLSSHETPHLNRALSLLLGERARFPRRISLHIGAGALILLLFLVSSLWFILASGFPEAVSVGIVGAAIAGVIVATALDHVPQRSKDERRGRPKPGSDASGRQPLRSLACGRVFRGTSVVCLALLWLFQEQVARVWTRGLLPIITDDGTWLLVTVGALMWAASLLGMLALYVGHRLSQRAASHVLAHDDRKPILYLRSFRDDESNNLNPESGVAALLGIRTPRWLPERFGAVRYLFSFHPIRFLRIAFGLAADTAEEQIANCLRRYGPFVAIGRPGERFAAPGAARMYVSHDTWQATVLDLMDRSQLIVLQPANTEGIWWEIKQTLERVEPQRMIMCLVNFKGRQDDYEAFRLRVEEAIGRPLPRSIGNLENPAILYFDRDGTARHVELRYHSPLVWPLLLQAADLRGTLAPLVMAASDGSLAAPSPPKKHRFHAPLAVLVYFFLFGILGLYVEEVRTATAARVVAWTDSAPESPATPPPVSRIVHAGKAADYRIALDSSWQRQPPSKGADAKFVRTEGGQIQIIAANTGEDVSAIAESYTTRLQKELSMPATLMFQRNIERRGKTWVEFQVAIELDKRRQIQHLRSYSDSQESYLLLSAYLTSESGAAEAIQQAFDSFDLPGESTDISPDGRIVYGGDAVAYRLILDHAWRNQNSRADLKLVTSDGAKLEIFAGAGKEDVSAFPDSHLDNLVAAYSADRVKSLYATNVRAGGVRWRELIVRVNTGDEIVERRVRYRSSDSGTFILIANYSAADSIARAQAEEALDGIYLPTANGDGEHLERQATTPGQ